MAYANKEVSMNILITSQANHKNALVDERFGRCDYYCIYNTNEKDFIFHNNLSKSANQGAGVSFSQKVLESNIDVILTGKIGPKALDILASSNINAFEVNNMNIEKAIQAYQNKTLKVIAIK